MDWRDFVRDHAIAVFVAGAVAVLILGTIIMMALPSRGHMLKLAFAALTLIALAVSSAIVLASFNLLPTLGIASSEIETGGLGVVLLVIIFLLWRIGSWWAAHIEAERGTLEKELKAIKASPTPVEVTISGPKGPVAPARH